MVMAERENPGGPSKRQKTTQQERAVRCSNLKKVESPRLRSSLWLEDDGTRLPGLCFKDRDELKKAVDWRSIRGQHICAVRETGEDEFSFECIRWKCNWSIRAVRMEKHGLFEITNCDGPDTCKQLGKSCPVYFDDKFLAYEIERVVSEHPTLTVAELHKWWNEKFGSEQTFLTHLDEEGEEVSDARGNLQDAKREAIKRLFGEWDQSFRFIPKLMSALHSSNGMIVDWQYDSLPNPQHAASFRSVFWAFSQSVQGFKHCRPLVVVDSKQLKGNYNMNLMIASGFDAANKIFPLAFAVTKEVSTDSWRWFLTRIREKVTQRKGLCLITRHHPDILAVVNEQWKEPWAYHRFCLTHLSSQFSRLFPDQHLTECLVMKAGSSIQKGEFDSYMKEIKEKKPEGWKWLERIPPHQWALAHDSGLRYGVMKIDRKALFAVCRSFQKVAMTGGVMLLFSEMKDAFDSSFSSSRGSLHRGDLYAKNVMKKFQESLTDSSAFVVKPLERDAFQVSVPLEKKERMSMARWHLSGKFKEYKEGIVQLNDSTCTCGKFQRKKFPCLHALAVCKKMKINPLQYADDCYSAERYYKTYEATFSPVPAISAWPDASGVPTLFPPVIATPPLKVSGNKSQRSELNRFESTRT